MIKQVYVLEKYGNEWAAFSLKVSTYDFFNKDKKQVIRWIIQKNKILKEIKK